jgi:hypothetical protein
LQDLKKTVAQYSLEALIKEKKYYLKNEDYDRVKIIHQ